MTSNHSKILRVLLGLALALAFAAPCLTTAASAQGTAAPQASMGQADQAMLRMPADMEAFDAAHPNLPGAMSPNLPTMDFAHYLALKAAAEFVGGVRPDSASVAPSGPEALGLGPVTCNGIGQNAPIAGGGFPPDTHGAIGANHFGQIVNQAVRWYTKANTGNCPTAQVMQSTLNGFFGYSAQALFDPRILYDLTYQRWIISAEGFQESASVQFNFIGVSLDSDPTHGFFIYAFNMAGIVGNGVFWDYPQIGYDEEAIILTGNKFNPGYAGSTPVFLPKHRMYAGLGFSYCFFNGGSLNVGTITPPNVLDQGPYTTLAIASPGAGFIRVHKVVGTSHACPTFLATNDIATPTNVPPLAIQPGVPAGNANKLDTLDGRFQSQGTQIGMPVFGAPVRFWQVRTDVAGGLPTPVTYKINADASTIEESCSLFPSATSNDFNPSIVANGAGTIFGTWSSTDPGSPSHNVQVRIFSKKSANACSPTQIMVNESANPLTGNFDGNKGFQRWGDTSASTLDPSDDTNFWFVNEKVQSSANPTTWKSYFGDASNP